MGCGEPPVHFARHAIPPLSGGSWKLTHLLALSDDKICAALLWGVSSSGDLGFGAPLPASIFDVVAEPRLFEAVSSSFW